MFYLPGQNWELSRGELQCTAKNFYNGENMFWKRRTLIIEWGDAINVGERVQNAGW